MQPTQVAAQRVFVRNVPGSAGEFFHRLLTYQRGAGVAEGLLVPPRVTLMVRVETYYQRLFVVTLVAAAVRLRFKIRG